MVTQKILIYAALSSTLLGGATTYFAIKNNFVSLIQPANNVIPANTVSKQETGNSSITATSDVLNRVIAIVQGTMADRYGTSSENGIQNTPEEPLQINSSNSVEKKDAGYKISSQKGYRLIKPILWAKPIAESQEFAAMKAGITSLIENDRRANLLTSASVYLYSFSDGEWTNINPNESFNPGSLIKVPLLITYLKEAEKDPKLLDKKVLCENFGYIPTQTYETNSINPGHTYTIRELLHYMIAYSDNNATALLNKNMDQNIFRKTFTDLHIAEPDLNDWDYVINAKRYSRFFIVLYNATYLSRSSSEYALKLLTECDFKNGIIKGVPKGVPVAHKFGEWGNKKINLEEIHESGIIYLNNRHYLLTVMTKGKDPKDLSEEISKISDLVYSALSLQPSI